MKRNQFFWAWGEQEPTPDKSMSRDRLAKLLRCWRTDRDGNRRHDCAVQSKRENGATTYRTKQYGVIATVVVRGL